MDSSVDSKAKGGKVVNYHCLVVWNWKTKALVLTTALDANGRKITIQFGTGKGTSATLAACIKAVTDVVVNFGGPNGSQQWATVSGVNDAIFGAAMNVWGLPVLN